MEALQYREHECVERSGSLSSEAEDTCSCENGFYPRGRARDFLDHAFIYTVECRCCMVLADNNM